MKIIIRIAAGLLVALSIACGGGSSGGSGGNAAGAAGFAANGSFETPDGFVTNIRVVDLGSNTPPSEDDCVGSINILVDDSAADVITGSGNCLLVNNSNAATYSLVGGFIDDTNFEGVITIVFSRVTHVLNFSGSLNGNQLEATFSGRTPQVGQLVIDWTGEFTASRAPVP